MRKNTKLVDAIFAEYVPIFDLELPYVWESIKIKNFLGFHSIEDFGTDQDFHFIGINFKLLENEEQLRETIAHELIHAWQYQNGLETDHGEDFAAWCAWFKIEHNLNTASEDVSAKEIFINYCNMKRGMQNG